MKITNPQPNKYRTFPLPSPDRLTPVSYSEDGFYVSQGSAKQVQLGQNVKPFGELFVEPAEDVTRIRFRFELE